MGRQIGSEERRLKDLLIQIGKLLNEARLTDCGVALLATPLPVAVSVEQAASLLGVAPSTVDEYVRAGTLPHFRLGRRKLVLLESLHTFAKKLEEAQMAADDATGGSWR